MIVFKYCDFRTFIKLNDKNGPYNIIVFRYCKQSMKAEKKTTKNSHTQGGSRYYYILNIYQMDIKRNKKLCLNYLIFLDFFLYLYHIPLVNFRGILH